MADRSETPPAAPGTADSPAPASPAPAAWPGAPALLLLSTAVAMLLVHGWFRALSGGAALVGAGALVRARRRVGAAPRQQG